MPSYCRWLCNLCQSVLYESSQKFMHSAPERACYEVTAFHFAILYLNVLTTFAPKCAEEFCECSCSSAPERAYFEVMAVVYVFVLYLCVLTNFKFVSDQAGFNPLGKRLVSG